MEEVVNKLKNEIVSVIAELVRKCLDEASLEIAENRGIQTGSHNIYPEIDNVTKRFARFLEYDFDKLIKAPTKKRVRLDDTSLNLVNEDFYESANALEGMVAFTRNANLKEYISFTARLNSLFSHSSIDESNNPLDPEQIGEAFIDSLRSLPLNAKDTLVVYRKFNQYVFYKLGKVLAQANQILVDRNVDPSLVVEARSRETQLRKRNMNRPVSDPVERAFSEEGKEEQSDTRRSGAPELFALLKNLTHGLSLDEKEFISEGTEESESLEVAIPVAAMTGQQFGDGSLTGRGLMLVNVEPDMTLGALKVELLSTERLVEILCDAQKKLNELVTDNTDIDKECQLAREAVCQLIHESASEGSISAVDVPSYDIINIITMLYEAIAKDVSLIAPIKKLICVTQVTIIRLALADQGFFGQTQHPARDLLNNVANAGIGWVDLEKLKADPTYQKMDGLISRLIAEFNGDNKLIEELLKDFDQFQAKQAEESIQPAPDDDGSNVQQQRAEKIDAYVTQKIKERMLEELHPVVATILLEHFHAFMAKLVMREGVGGNSWKHVINTIDELLWSVKSEKSEGDRDRLEKVNPKILANLNKALGIAGLDEEATEKILAELQEVQEESFKSAENKDKEQAALDATTGGSVISNDIQIDFGDEDDSPEEDSPEESTTAIETDEYLLQVNKLPLGVWVEFKFSGDRMVPCTLAAKLDTIDKFIFVNRQGVKMVEKSRRGLARELKNGSVKIISEWPLFERAMESIIGNLREAKSA